MFDVSFWNLRCELRVVWLHFMFTWNLLGIAGGDIFIELRELRRRIIRCI